MLGFTRQAGLRVCAASNKRGEVEGVAVGSLPGLAVRASGSSLFPAPRSATACREPENDHSRSVNIVDIGKHYDQGLLLSQSWLLIIHQHIT